MVILVLRVNIDVQKHGQRRIGDLRKYGTTGVVLIKNIWKQNIVKETVNTFQNLVVIGKFLITSKKNKETNLK